MSRIKETEVFTYDELSDDAKEKARAWWVEGVTCDNLFDAISNDVRTVANIIGIEFFNSNVKLMDGSYRLEPKIWFSGFDQQGDGACFDGTYGYAKGASKHIREHAPEDMELHEIADILQEVQRKYFYGLNAFCRHEGDLYHSGCLTVKVGHNEGSHVNVRDADKEKVVDALRRFADWIYGLLAEEADYITSDHAAEEFIRNNQYEFLVDGSVA